MSCSHGNVRSQRRKDGQDDAQNDRGASTEHDRELALARWQPVGRHPDHDGIVAAEHQVDQNDRQRGSIEL